ncbi:hypothetical protein TNCV_3514801 [Trichonephila clavipes]|nr:hypothetical protein TNCV_3514801 [Trichonephila clavipes]
MFRLIICAGCMSPHNLPHLIHIMGVGTNSIAIKSRQFAYNSIRLGDLSTDCFPIGRLLFPIKLSTAASGYRFRFWTWPTHSIFSMGTLSPYGFVFQQ